MTLSAKRRAFVEEYLRCWNATEAAKRAGYAERSAQVQGSRLLSDDMVAGYVKQRLAELAMSADEVLIRLGQQARAEYAPYITRSGQVDLEQMIADGKAHLIKGTKWDRDGNLIVEFYDAQAALALIGRHHALFTDRTQQDVTIDVDAARDELERRVAEYMARRGSSGATERPEQ